MYEGLLRGGRLFFSLGIAMAALAMLIVPGPAAAGSGEQSLADRFEEASEEARLLLADRLAEPSLEYLKDLESLRNRLARDRDLAGKIAEAGTLETRILEAKIRELGPLPGEGKSEPSAITQRREALDTELAGKMGPILRMRERRAHASTLVAEIDERINALKHRKLMRRGYSALDPRLWADSFGGLGGALSNAGAAIGKSVKTHGLGSILALLGLALAIAVLGPVLLNRVWKKVRVRIENSVAGNTSLARNLGLIVLENVGSAVVFGVSLLLATTVLILLLVPFVATERLVALGLVFFVVALLPAVAQWLGRSVFLSPYPELRLIRLPDERAQKAVRTVRYAGIVLALETVLASVEESATVSSSLAGFLSAIFVILGSALLWSLASLVISSRADTVAPTDGDDGGHKEQFDFATPLGQFLKLFAIASFFTALAGYVLLAREIFSSALATLAVIAIALYLNRTIKLITSAAASSALKGYRRPLRFLPLLTGLVLLVGTLLLTALIWGYRPQEIGDGLIALRDGIDFGDVRISAGDVFTFALVFIVGYAVTRFVQRFLRLSILPQFDLDRGGMAAIITGVGYLGILLAAVIAIASTGLDLSSLAFVAGALSVGLGFGLQSVVENFTSGILLLVERPIKEGDWIEVGEYSGLVRKISVRSTQIETFDRHHIIIPNSQLITGSVKNLSFSGGPARITVLIGVSYDSDVDKVRALMLDIAKDTENVLAEPEPIAVLAGFGDNSIDFKLLCFVADVTTGAGTQSELNFEIARRFEKEGIEIPFPQRDIHIRSGANDFPGPAEPSPGQG